MLAAIRRVRLAWWVLALRARLRRQGMTCRVTLGRGVRFGALPHVELDPFASGRGGSLELRVGEDVRLGRGLTLDVRPGTDNVLELGDRVIFQSWCRVQLHGGRITLAEDVHVRDLVQIKSKSDLRVGARSVLSRDVVVHATVGVTIGGLRRRRAVELIDSDHTLDGSGGPYLQAPLLTDPIVLGRGVALGANCVVLRGSRLGDGSALAAGAVAGRLELEPGWLAAGAPARPLRSLRVGESSG